MLSFFLFVGGFYGCEPYATASPWDTLLWMAGLLCLTYCLPTAAMTAELAERFPAGGGFADWVYQALGPRLGAHSAWWTLGAELSTAATNPVWASAYIAVGFHVTEHEQQVGIALGLLLLVLLIQLVGGLKFAAKLAIFCSVACLIPAALYMIAGIPKIGGQVWEQKEAPPTRWAVLYGLLIFQFSGLDACGTVSNDVRREARKSGAMCISNTVLIPLNLFCLLVPLSMSLSIDPDTTNYKVGYFAVLCRKLPWGGGKWLEFTFVAGALAALVGCLNSYLVSAQFTMAVILNRQVGGLLRQWAVDGNPPGEEYKEDKHTKRSCCQCGVRWLCNELIYDPYGTTPISAVYIVLSAIMVAGLCLVPYVPLVELTALSLVPYEMLEYVSYVKLRLHLGEQQQSFRVPGGSSGAVLIGLIPMVVLAVFVAFQVQDTASEYYVIKMVGVPMWILVGVLIDATWLGLQRVFPQALEGASMRFERVSKEHERYSMCEISDMLPATDQHTEQYAYGAL